MIAEPPTEEKVSAASPGRKPPCIELPSDEKQHLDGLVRRVTAPQREVFRARIILLADDGLSSRDIALQLDCDEDTVGKWRLRYAEQGPKGLRDLPRSGRPRTFSAEQVASVLHMATQWPKDNGIPVSHWDAALLQKAAIDAGITESIHPTTIWRWLRDADIKPHQVQYWLRSTDPDFQTRMQDVTGLYLSAPELASQGIKVFSVDEKTSIQALERKHPDLPPISGTPQRIEHEYTRHGTLCLTAAFNVATGEVHGSLTPNRPAPVFAGFIDGLCHQVGPEAPAIHFVMDQLNTHWHHDFCKVVADHSGIPYDPKEYERGDDRRRFLMRDDKRVIVHYTPKHASWLNQIEIWFSVLARKLLKRETFRSLAELKERILQFMTYHNRYLAHPYRWTYTGAPCRS